MSVIGSNVLAGASGGAGAANFQIERSLRFNSADSAYLNRTPSSAGNRKTWTWSGWVKIAYTPSNNPRIFSAGSSSSDTLEIALLATAEANELRVLGDVGGSRKINWTTANKFRDPGAWFHLVVALDTTQATAANRLKVYINGSQVTSTGAASTYPSQNDTFEINNTSIHYIGRSGPYTEHFNGYLADINFIDGQALAPTDFGEFDDNNVWQPIEYSGTYGTNGFHLDFSDNSSNAALGTDSSGNSNTWTVNNLTANRNEPYAYYWTGTFLAGEPGENAFDGSSVSAARPDSSQTITWTHPTGIAFTKLRIKAAQSGSGTTISVNGTNVSSSFSSNATVDLTSTITSPLTTISLTSTASDRPKLFFVEINDVILVSGHNTDVFLDSPTDYEADSGNPGGNYCSWNPLHPTFATTSFSNANLDTSLQFTNGSATPYVVGTIAVSSGKWYWEIALTQESNDTEYIGFIDGSKSGEAWVFADIGAYFSDARKAVGTTPSSYGTTYTTGDVIGVALDADNGSLTFYKNGTSQGVAATGMTFASYKPFISSNGTSTPQLVSANFGQRPFAYTPPTDYKSLCTQNLDDSLIADPSTVMDVALYTGDDGTNRAITGLNMSPDFVWIKQRSDISAHMLFDAVRGATKRLVSNQTLAEGTVQGVTSFDSNGFTLGNDPDCNLSPRTHVAWAWDAGANSSKTYTVKVVSDSGNKYRFDDYGTSAVTLDLEEGSTYVFDQSDSSNATHPLRFSTTSDGTHGSGTEYTTGVTTTGTPGQSGAKTTITVASGAPTLYYYCSAHSGMGGQANTNSTAGASNFDGSIQSTVRRNASAGFSIVTWTGTGASGTIGHELNVAPKLIIIKSGSGTTNWVVFTTAVDGSLDYLYLNLTSAKGDSGSGSIASSTFDPGSGSNGNPSGASMVAYCFSPVSQYSSFGVYTGNGNADGPCVFTGFKPAFIVRKRTDTSGYGWYIIDATRDTYNVSDAFLDAADSDAEGTGAQIDILSNGFKLRTNSASTNASGGTYLYAAFAEHPFKTARAR